MPPRRRHRLHPPLTLLRQRLRQEGRMPTVTVEKEEEVEVVVVA
jgi:hypothetical protein